MESALSLTDIPDKSNEESVDQIIEYTVRTRSNNIGLLKDINFVRLGGENFKINIWERVAENLYCLFESDDQYPITDDVIDEEDYGPFDFKDKIAYMTERCGLETDTPYDPRQIIDEQKNGRNRVVTEKDYMKRHSMAGKRELPLTAEAIAILEELRIINGDKPYILANRSEEKPIITNRFNQNLKKACEGAKIPYLSSHKIRFGIVTSMYEAGISEIVIQSWAGHNNIATTRHYDSKRQIIRSVLKSAAD